MAKPEEEVTEPFSFEKYILDRLPKGPNRGLFWDFVCSIFEPGVNSGLLFVIHLVFSTLIMVQVGLMILVGSFNIHFFFLTLLSAFLYVSLLIFIKESERARLAESKKEE